MKYDSSLYKPLQIFTKNITKNQITTKLKKNINVKRKKGMYLYNYNNMVHVPRDHSILILCRGLVLNKQGQPLNYPFQRFFNYFESEFKGINWLDSTIQEKIDGSMINVFINNQGQWEITTRGSFYPNTKADIQFDQLFKKFFTQFDKLDRNNCYMFELVTKQNPVVKYYEEEFIVLLGARNLSTYEELNQTTLDTIAYNLNVRRPRKYQANNLYGALELFNKFDPDDEGLVVVDEKFNRLKIKQDSYFKLSKIKLLREQDMLDYVCGKTEIDNEIIQRDQTVAQKIKVITNEYNQFIHLVHTTFDQIKLAIDRKTFAAHALKYPFSALLFKLYDGQNIEEANLNYDLITNSLKIGLPK